MPDSKDGGPIGTIARLRAIPSSIWALGFVSMLMDVSSESIHALLPIYLVTVLGASNQTVGLIEGVAGATASVARVFSGALSDWIGKRKLLVVLGYGLAALSKPIFPLAKSVGWVLFARFVDRIGKGVRDAPRDALVADLSPVELRGASIGLRKSLDTAGGFIGPGIAILLMWLTADNYHVVFWVAVVPALVALVLLLSAVREPDRPRAAQVARFSLSLAAIRQLGLPYCLVVGLASVFGLASFSEAFLILRAQGAGLPVVIAPLVFVVMNVVSTGAAYPAGVLSDRYNRLVVLGAGFVVLIAADLVLAFAGGLPEVMIGIALWGLQAGLTAGLFSTLVADTSPTELRGTAYGLFNLANGAALLVASLAAGGLWDRLGPGATFGMGAGLALIALCGLLAVGRLVPWLAQPIRR